jgi:WD40 repeat protein
MDASNSTVNIFATVALGKAQKNDMKRLRWLWVFLVAGLVLVGIVLGQERPRTFALVRQLGEPAPQGILYDPNFDRFAWTDQDGRLVLVDAKTRAVQHILYEGRTYNDYAFSHDGNWLALVIELRAELWNTNTGQLVTQLEPEGALSMAGPLQFSADDKLLNLTAVVRAPQAIRRSEFDTSNLPYIWDIAAARRERNSALPNRVDAQPFFDYRNGFLLTPNDRLFAALPDRVQMLSIGQGYPVLSELSTLRNERDPMVVWYSARDRFVYFRPQNSGELIQFDTADGAQFNIRPGVDYGGSGLAALQGLRLSNLMQPLGALNSTQSNSFLRLLLGDNYRAIYNYNPISVTLLDYLIPITQEAQQAALLVYIWDEQNARGTVDFLRPPDIREMTLHPDGRHMLVQRISGALESYALDTGVLERTIMPAVPYDSVNIMTYSGDGDQIIANAQRFNLADGGVVFEDLNIRPPFNAFTFANTDQLITFTNEEWWLWDIPSGNVIRRERLNFPATLLESSRDGQRYLFEIDGGRLVWDFGMEQQSVVRFAQYPARAISQVLPSPDWQYFAVTYSYVTNGNDQRDLRGDDLALYHKDQGLLWYANSQDLPDPANRSYSWINNQQLAVSATTFVGDPRSEAARVYGVDYLPNGVPTCLAQAFPNDLETWTLFWARVHNSWREDRAAQLALGVCAALTEAPEAQITPTQAVGDLLYPTATPTRPPVTSTPSTVAGVPTCLTATFPREALEYAAIWRDLAAGKSPDELRDLEELLCSGIGRVQYVNYGDQAFDDGSRFNVMLFEAQTGERRDGGFIPSTPVTTRSLDPVVNAFRNQYGFFPDAPALSADGRYFAHTTFDGYVQVYQLVQSYDEIVSVITQTAQSAQTNAPLFIVLQPTFTPTFGVPYDLQPTLTPTLTPTFPALPQATAPQYATEITFTEVHGQRYTRANAPADFAPAGRLYVDRGDGYSWTLNLSDGVLYLDDTVPDAYTYTPSPDQNWLLFTDQRGMVISRADGSDARLFFDALQVLEWNVQAYWVDDHIIEYRYSRWVNGTPSRQQQPFVERYDMDTDAGGGALVPYATPTDQPRLGGDFNDRYGTLPYQRIGTQPITADYYLASLPFNVMGGYGYEYSIFSVQDVTTPISTFARIENRELAYQWRPDGSALYYNITGGREWMVYTPADNSHRVFGILPNGAWSPNGRYVANWFDRLPYESAEIERRVQAGEPMVKLYVWDSDTGQARAYSIPDTGSTPISANLIWSPDNRYVLFRFVLPSETVYTGAPNRVFILDLESGAVVEYTDDFNHVLLWVEDVP